MLATEYFTLGKGCCDLCCVQGWSSVGPAVSMKFQGAKQIWSSVSMLLGSENTRDVPQLSPAGEEAALKALTCRGWFYPDPLLAVKIQKLQNNLRIRVPYKHIKAWSC